MTITRRLRRGEIVLISFPFTDLSSAKVRPAVIVGRVIGPDIILAFITSQAISFDPRTDVLIATGDSEYAESGLAAASVIRCSKLATLDRSLVRRRLGNAGPETIRRIDACLRRALDLSEDT